MKVHSIQDSSSESTNSCSLRLYGVLLEDAAAPRICDSCDLKLPCATFILSQKDSCIEAIMSWNFLEQPGSELLHHLGLASTCLAQQRPSHET